MSTLTVATSHRIIYQLVILHIKIQIKVKIPDACAHYSQKLLILYGLYYLPDNLTLLTLLLFCEKLSALCCRQSKWVYNLYLWLSSLFMPSYSHGWHYCNLVTIMSALCCSRQNTYISETKCSCLLHSCLQTQKADDNFIIMTKKCHFFAVDKTDELAFGWSFSSFGQQKTTESLKVLFFLPNPKKLD